MVPDLQEVDRRGELRPPLVPHHIPRAIRLAFLELRVPLRVPDEQQPLCFPLDEQDDASVVGDLAGQLRERERGGHHPRLQITEIRLADVPRERRRLRRILPEQGAARHESLQVLIDFLSEVEMIDIALRTEDVDVGAHERQPEVRRRHPGVHVFRRDAVLLRQRRAQRFHRTVIVDPEETHQFLELGTERQVQAGDVAHRSGRETAQPQRELGLRMFGIHRRVHPNILDLHIREEVGIKAGDMILVLVGDHHEVEPLLAAARVRQHRLEVLKCRFQVRDAAHRTAVDQHVEVVHRVSDSPRVWNAAV